MTEGTAHAPTTTGAEPPNNGAAPRISDPRGAHASTTKTTASILRRTPLLPFVARSSPRLSDAVLAAELAVARVSSRPRRVSGESPCYECSSHSLEWLRWAGATHGGCPHRVAGAA